MNCIPNTQAKLENLAIPFSLILTPLVESDDITKFDSCSFRCTCGGYMVSNSHANL